MRRESDVPVQPLRLEQFETLFDAVPYGIYVADADFRIAAMNQAALPAFGEIPGGVIGRDLEEIVRLIWQKDFADEVIGIFRRVLETGEAHVVAESSEERADRHVMEAYEWRVDRILMSDARYGIAVFFREISGRKQADLARQRLAAIVESSDDAIISKDLDGVILTWNAGAERIFGYKAAEVIGKPVSILIPLERLDEEPNILDRIQRGERIEHYETVRRRKDGTLFDISLTVSPMRDANGKVIGASKIARDVSLKKQAEATRQLLLNELNHRVKNTLANVQAIAQQTLASTKDPADFAQRFSGRIQSLARAHSLLTDATWQGADLRELIRDQLWHGPVDETRLTAWGPAVHLGPQTTLHLALMLHELGTNSVKHGALSVPAGWVTVGWSVKDDMLHLEWKERGGPPVSAPIARGFGTTLIEQSAKSEGGRAQMICEAKGVTWDIVVALPKSSGRRLVSGIPESELLSPGSSQESGGAAKARLALAGRRFLVIEDEPLIALALVSSLESFGATAKPVGTEKEALPLIEGGGFDAALLDANLHGRPVGEVAAALTRRKTPFIFVTGYGRQGLPESFGHMPILTKPFSDQQLVDAAVALLSKSAGVVPLKKER